MLACVLPTALGWGRLEPQVRFTVLLCALYLGASTMVSAYPRQLSVAVPFLLLWIAAVTRRTITVSVRVRG